MLFYIHLIAGFDEKASDAVDFSDINETADDEEEKARVLASMSSLSVPKQGIHQEFWYF